jgi:hypothetical protein
MNQPEEVPGMFRYTRLVMSLEKARARYEADVRRIIQSAAEADAKTDAAILTRTTRRKPRKKLHWTQTPEGRRKMSLAQLSSYKKRKA